VIKGTIFGDIFKIRLVRSALPATMKNVPLAEACVRLEHLNYLLQEQLRRAVAIAKHIRKKAAQIRPSLAGTYLASRSPRRRTADLAEDFCPVVRPTVRVVGDSNRVEANRIRCSTTEWT